MLLDSADQALSDRAVTACSAAKPDVRDAAHRMAREVAPDASILWRTCLYGAYCYLMHWNGVEPNPTLIPPLALRLAEIHDTHTAAIQARAAA